MKKIHAALFLSLILLTSACNTTSMSMSGKMLMSVQPGMSKLEVRNILGGDPDYRRFDGNTEEWEYRRYSPGINNGWSVILIEFTDGSVSRMDSFTNSGTTTILDPSPTAITTIGGFPNRYSTKEIQVMSDTEFERFYSKLKSTIMSDEKKEMIDRMLRRHDVTSDQSAKIVKEISYSPDQVEMAKKLYPYVTDKRNFNKVIDILFSETYKEEVRKFIQEFHQNNK